jgi:hypothetical protein
MPEKSNGEIYKQIPLIMTDVSAIGKNQKGPGYKFRGIDDLYNALQKVMARRGVFSTSEILHSERSEIVSKSGAKGYLSIIRYRYTFWAADGSSVPMDAIGECIDYGDKASNKCAAIAHKYALLQIFCIPTEEMQDPDAYGHELVKSKRPVGVESLTNAFGKLQVTKEMIEDKGFKIDSLTDDQMIKLRKIYKVLIEGKTWEQATKEL